MKMKTNRILAAAVLVASLASCTQKLQFTDVPFATFDKITIGTSETAGTVEIGVTATSCTKSFSVVFEVIENTAKAGTHFEILDNPAQVLSFTPQNPTQVIKVGVIDLSGTFTGDTNFSLKLASATEGVNLNGNTVCKISIKDFDHPLSEMLGTYISTETDAFNQATSITVTIEPDPDDTYKVWINPISHFLAGNGLPGELPVYGIVSTDKKTITVPYFQNTGFDVSVYGVGVTGDDLTLYSWAVEADDVVVVDSGITAIKFEWSDEAGGYVNDSKFCLGGAITGKLGNFYYMYVPEKAMLLKKQ